jgi:hypothetical protein
VAEDPFFVPSPELTFVIANVIDNKTSFEESPQGFDFFPTFWAQQWIIGKLP